VVVDRGERIVDGLIAMMGGGRAVSGKVMSIVVAPCEMMVRSDSFPARGAER